MSLLFDIPPDEPKKAKKKPARPGPALEPAPAPAPREVPHIAMPATLGRLDGTVACLDQTCQGLSHDIVADDRGQWLVECCLCGTGQWLPAIPGVIEPPKGKFVFHAGRFAGLTIDQAAAQPRGLEYLEWAAREHPKQAVRKACETWLADSRGAL